MYKKIIDSFLPSGQQSGDLRAQRIFINVLFISAVADIMGIGMALHLGLRVIAGLLVINAVLNIVLLFLYRLGFSKSWIGHFSLVHHAISFIIQAWYQGGLVSPGTAAYFLLPAVALLILGKTSAIIWFVVTTVIMTGFYVYESVLGAPQVLFSQDEKAFLFFGAILGTNVALFILLLVYEENKNKAYELVEKKHRDLVNTQNQLIQAEKMASLGELTAGIAHEIQNPLNFVNNFSEVSSELLTELVDELNNGNKQEAKAIAADLTGNLEKINYHGQRAADIVKGMLQHSRTNTSQKEPTDINLLCDEYLRLAYHGLRAKDKTFNASFETQLDPGLPVINVVPQDIGRVILNIISNAFYAVNEKSKLGIPDYKPTVTVTTKLNTGNTVMISIKDNGPGIPDHIKEKIFQPFFTTKPTGQGTGLGLSLAYDIVTKGYGGELKLESKEGEGSTFTIQLPFV